MIRHHVYCLLDENYRSESLLHKISDISYRIRCDISERVRTHPEYIQRLLSPLSAQKIQLDLTRDRQFIISLALKYDRVIKFVPEIQCEKQVALKLLFRNNNDWNGYNSLCNYLVNNRDKHKLFSDKEWVLEVFKKSTYLEIGFLQSFVSYFSDELKRDPQVAKCIVIRSYKSLEKFDDSIKSNRKLILEIVKEEPHALRFANRKFMDDFEILNVAACNSHSIIGFIDNVHFLKYWLSKYPHDRLAVSFSTLEKYPELFLILIEKGIYDLTNADEKFITKERLLAFLKSGSKKICYPQKFRTDKTIFMESVKLSAERLQYADVSLKKDKNFILDLIEINPFVVKYMDSALCDDCEIADLAVKRNGLLLQYFSPIVKGNDQIEMKAILQNPNSIQFSLFQNIEIVMEVVQRDGKAIQFVNRQFREVKHVVLAAVRQNGHSLQFIETSMRLDREIVIEALNNGCPFCKVDPLLRGDKEIAIVALRNDARSFNLIESSIRNDEDILEEKSKGKRFISWEINWK